MIRYIYRILPVFVFVWFVRKIGCETHWTEHGSWYMPYKDVLIRKKNDPTY